MVLSLVLIFVCFSIIFLIGVVIQFSLKLRTINFGITFFLGFVTLTVILSWLSIILPINSTIIFTILGAIIGLSILKYQKLKVFVSERWDGNQARIPSILLASFMILISAGLAAQIAFYDCGLYHIQNIKWIENYAVVPGLGNLHGRFAFNSHFFLPSSFFHVDLSTIKEDVLVYPLNAACALALFVFLMNSLKSASNVLKIFFLSILAYFILLYPQWINTPSPDIISAFVVIIMSITILTEKEFTKTHFYLFTLIAFCAATIKLSNALLIVYLIPVVAKRNFTLKSKDFGFMALLGLIVLTPFLIRNYLLSGYLVYPIHRLDFFNVDWKIPIEKVILEKEHIKWWARNPDLKAENLVLPFTLWIVKWWAKKSVAFKLLLGLNALLPFTLLTKSDTKSNIRIVTLLVLINLIFWFITAPDPRFAHGFLIIGASITLFVSYQLFSSRIKQINISNSLSLISVFGLILLGFFTVRVNVSDHWLYPTALPSNTLQFHTSNFEYWVPVEDTRCYNAPLPCAEREKPGLVLRGETFESGFKIEKKN